MSNYHVAVEDGRLVPSIPFSRYVKILLKHVRHKREMAHLAERPDHLLDDVGLASADLRGPVTCDQRFLSSLEECSEKGRTLRRVSCWSG